tara:strand:- start:365 stop:1327 length:963 start_codon:yes stop_codon:yes gene_type:complete
MVEDEEDPSPVKGFISTSNALYVFKEESIYKVQLADDIDPGRTNYDIPNLNQKILPAGENNEVVARVLLTTKCLFDENNATVSPFVGAFLEQSIYLTKHILELQEMIYNLRYKIIQKEEIFKKKEYNINNFSLPFVSGLDQELHNILVKADRAKDSILALYRLHFFPEGKKKPNMDEYDVVINDKLLSKPDILAGWNETIMVLRLIRNIRNASEHRRDGNQLRAQDFEMQPDGSINSPIVGIEHKDTPIEPIQVVDFLDLIDNMILDHAEGSIVTIRCAVLLDNNPFNEQVGYLPAEKRRHPLVRYCRLVNLDGEMRILG